MKLRKNAEIPESAVAIVVPPRIETKFLDVLIAKRHPQAQVLKVISAGDANILVADGIARPTLEAWFASLGQNNAS